jgi:diacylglycerol kinase (ATP)
VAAPEPEADLKPRALVVLNPAARRGRGREAFATVRAVVQDAFDVDLVETAHKGYADTVARALRDGIRVFVAAGGDGTVHALVNAIVATRGDVPLESIAMGAVGLGSSNDFHKPVRRSIDGVPVRIDLTAARPRDLARAIWDDGDRVFAVSASLGIVASANARFDGPGPMLANLERHWVRGAILYAAVRTILGWRNLDATLTIEEMSSRVRLTTLSVGKTPWVSGRFHYDTPVEPDDGRLLVNLCEGMTRIRALGTLVALARGRFDGRPGTRWWRVPALTVALDEPSDLELDGELFRARIVRYEVLAQRVLLCG